MKIQNSLIIAIAIIWLIVTVLFIKQMEKEKIEIEISSQSIIQKEVR